MYGYHVVKLHPLLWKLEKKLYIVENFIGIFQVEQP